VPESHHSLPLSHQSPVSLGDEHSEEGQEPSSSPNKEIVTSELPGSPNSGFNVNIKKMA